MASPRLLTAFGTTRTLTEWARALGMSSSTLRSRLDRRMPLEDALRREVGISPGEHARWHHEAFGEKHPLAEWAARYHIPITTLRVRMQRYKMSLEDALLAGSRQTGGARRRSHADALYANYDEPWSSDSDDPCAWMGGGLSRYGRRLLRRSGSAD